MQEMPHLLYLTSTSPYQPKIQSLRRLIPMAKIDKREPSRKNKRNQFLKKVSS